MFFSSLYSFFVLIQLLIWFRLFRNFLCISIIFLSPPPETYSWSPPAPPTRRWLARSLPSLPAGVRQHILPEVPRAAGPLRRQERHLLLPLPGQDAVQGRPQGAPAQGAPGALKGTVLMVSLFRDFF